MFKELNYTRKNFERESKDKGITLIALIITVIMLLILAGTAITLSINGGDLFEKPESAKNKWNNATLKEEVQLALMLNWQEPTLKERLDPISGAEVEKVNVLNDVCYVTKGDSVVTVYEDGDILDGKVEVWDGTSISSPEFKKVNDVWNWYIYKPSQLKFLADFVNNGRSLNQKLEQKVKEEGYTDTSIVSLTNTTEVHLMNNLDMGAREGIGETPEQKWETDANKNVKWTPIGSEINNNTITSKSFPCLFEGNNYTIRGLYVNESEAEEGYAGLFAGRTEAVWHLTLKSSYIKGKAAGGIALLNRQRFKECSIVDSVVIATEASAGGIVIVSWGNISDCTNYNTSVYGQRYVGGIIGQKNSSSKTVGGCKNTGTVTGKNNVGGIIGQSHNNIFTTITGCTNEGEIHASNFYCGGIVGNGKVSITNSHNTGTIICEGNQAGRNNRKCNARYYNNRM